VTTRRPGRDEEEGGAKVPQGGGELSGLLRHAEVLQRELDKALADLRQEFVDGRDAARLAQVRLSGDGAIAEVKLQITALGESDRKALEEALSIALRSAVERLFELRRKRATTVTKGLSLPGLFT
jgi:DNA-binding protein YbaB